LNPPKYFTDREINFFTSYSKIDPQKEYMAGIKRNPPSIRWTNYVAQVRELAVGSSVPAHGLRGARRRRGERAKVQCAARHCELLPWVLCGTDPT
jgi:hypothetical protein